MIGKVLLDTGPLVAMLDRRDRYHTWVIEQLGQIIPPLLTCESVLAEACYLMPRAQRPATDPLELVTRGVVRIAFALHEHCGEVAALMQRYANVPMSLAEASLVRMSELTSDCTVLTLDGDFRVYRRHGKQKIALRIPSGR